MSESQSTVTSAPSEQPPKAPKGQMWFGGSKGPVLLAKIGGLAIVDALAIYGALTLWAAEAWGYLAALAALTALVNWAYISPRSIPAKYLVPGLVFLLIYQVFVVGYTLVLSFTNFGDGNQGTKEGAIESLVGRNEVRVEGAPTLELTVIRAGGEIGFQVVDPQTGDLSAGFAERPLEPVEPGEFTELNLAEILEVQDEVTTLRVPISDDVDDGSIRALTTTTAAVFAPTLVYDEDADTLTNTETGETFVADDERGVFVSEESGTAIRPGWQVFVGFDNYTRIITDDRIRGPFIEVFVWNLVFGALSVVLPFALGLLGAMTLQHKTMRGTRFYRSILILPYAIPAFLTTLVWQGMFNTQFGFINEVLLGGRGHRLADRPVAGEVLRGVRPAVAGLPVLPHRQYRRSDRHPGRRPRGRQGRRSVGDPDVLAGEVAAAARCGGAAAHRVVRVQLQQLQRDPVPHRWRSDGHDSGRQLRSDRHPHHLRRQAGVLRAPSGSTGSPQRSR